MWPHESFLSKDTLYFSSWNFGCTTRFSRIHHTPIAMPPLIPQRIWSDWMPLYMGCEEMKDRLLQDDAKRIESVNDEVKETLAELWKIRKVMCRLFHSSDSSCPRSHATRWHEWWATILRLFILPSVWRASFILRTTSRPVRNGKPVGVGRW